MLTKIILLLHGVFNNEVCIVYFVSFYCRKKLWLLFNKFLNCMLRCTLYFTLFIYNLRFVVVSFYCQVQRAQQYDFRKSLTFIVFSSVLHNMTFERFVGKPRKTHSQCYLLKKLFIWGLHMTESKCCLCRRMLCDVADINTKWHVL